MSALMRATIGQNISMLFEMAKIIGETEYFILCFIDLCVCYTYTFGCPADEIDDFGLAPQHERMGRRILSKKK